VLQCITYNMSNPVVLSFQDSVLRENDLHLLEGPHWLNDSLIGFYFEYLQNIMFKGNPDVLFIGPEVTQVLKGSSKEELPIFLDPLDVKSKKYIFLPLNDCEATDKPGGSHWSLMCYSRPEQKMFHLDSAGSNFRSARKLVCNIAFALSDEGCDYDEFECLHQENSYDCGIFVICHAEMIARHCLLEGKSMQTFGLLEPQMIKNKRQDMLNIIKSLIKNSKK
jgi:sentrin-specific protease 8